MIGFCKDHDITVNDAIATAFIAALQSVDKKKANKTVRLGCAASIRDELVTPVSDCMGNYVTGISTQVSYDFNKNFLANTKVIGTTLRKKLNNLNSRYQVIKFLDVLDKDFMESIMYAAYGDYNHPVSKELGKAIGERFYLFRLPFRRTLSILAYSR